MKRTYILKNDIGDTIEYFARLTDAKRYLLKTPEYSILAVRGGYFGEGFHTHRYTVVNGKIKRESLR